MTLARATSQVTQLLFGVAQEASLGRAEQSHWVEEERSMPQSQAAEPGSGVSEAGELSTGKPSRLQDGESLSPGHL